MIRIFETGDLHIGKNYADKNKHPEGRALAEKRVDALTGMVDEANREKCDLFVVTGDMFDKTYGIAKKRVAKVVDELSRFNGTVLVLPGNHDYYSEDSVPEVWKVFTDCADGHENIVLLSSFEPYELQVGDDEVVVYPAFCHVDTAPENNLGWIKNLEIPQDEVYRIGIAHGAVEGETIDSEGVYFQMSRRELDAIPVDVWLIGHTHVMFPNNLTTDYCKSGKIFNAGTHVQTDVHNNTEGNAFIIEIEKDLKGEPLIRAKRFVSGNVRFKRFEIHVKAEGTGAELRDSIINAISKVDDNTSVSMIISGTVSREEYRNKEMIYQECLERFFEYAHPDDGNLIESISEDFIRREFSELTFPAKLLLKLVDEPKKAQMAYDLLTSKECQV